MVVVEGGSLLLDEKLMLMIIHIHSFYSILYILIILWAVGELWIFSLNWILNMNMNMNIVFDEDFNRLFFDAFGGDDNSYCVASKWANWRRFWPPCWHSNTRSSWDDWQKRRFRGWMYAQWIEETKCLQWWSRFDHWTTRMRVIVYRWIAVLSWIGSRHNRYSTLVGTYNK